MQNTMCKSLFTENPDRFRIIMHYHSQMKEKKTLSHPCSDLNTEALVTYDIQPSHSLCFSTLPAYTSHLHKRIKHCLCIPPTSTENL